MLLIGRSNFPRATTNQKHNPDLGEDTSSVWNFYSRFSDVRVGQISAVVPQTEYRLFSHATILQTQKILLNAEFRAVFLHVIARLRSLDKRKGKVCAEFAC